ncbi:MAG: thiol peroxidase [Methylomonas sp.]|nr:thiol peroxidase [Methylomonas sp.]PPD20943.1 MAG: lipid hydroperoxide peroxidase [Methylomonas sp.]PPD23712.1 MAG: lipid hydroperoxide peroxidase [Methylomonas sp.]PPD31646.1 MAG: lipid hydroperoxide peroxidase [Methylomonas sp.]PPD41298.1 MAG: lipid hydroperoxide peroxidase [Methylomonas sp.]
MAAITFHGTPVNTCGELPAIGSKAPDFRLTNRHLQDVALASFAGKRKLLSIVPSLDAPTCQTATRKFNETAAQFDDTEVLVISADLPFAQARFCESDGIRHLTALSSFRSTFARDYGVELLDGLLAGLTARAIVIINENDVVTYSQWASEITDEPDYNAVLGALRYG